MSQEKLLDLIDGYKDNPIGGDRKFLHGLVWLLADLYDIAERKGIDLDDLMAMARAVLKTGRIKKEINSGK